MSNTRLLPNQERTDLVTFTIFTNGQKVGKEIGVASIAVNKEVNKISWAKVTVRDGDVSREDFEVSNQQTFKPGNSIEIKAGYHSNENTIFKGIIIKHGIKIHRDRHSLLEIECRDVAIKLTAGKKNKYFISDSGIKDAEVIEQIARTYSLQNDIKTETTDATHKEIVQYYSTDWDFIVSRAEICGKLVVTDDGILKAKKPDFTQQPVVTLQYGGTIIELEATMDATHQYAGVNAASWSYANQQLSEQEATDPGIQEEGNLSSSDLSSVLGLDSYRLRHSGKINDQELRAWASSLWLKANFQRSGEE